MIKHLFLLSAIFLSAANCFAQTDSVTKLNEVVISYQANKHTPVTYQNLYGAALKQKSTGQEPSFLLSETPSITAYSDAGNTTGYSYYRIRGIDQTRINTTLDGMPMNEPEDQGAYFSNYPDLLNSISKIQIQRGSSTSKNGVASYAGSIELFSPDLYDSSNTTVGLSYGSFNTLRIFGEYNSGIKAHKAFYARASQIHSDGYKYNSSNNSQSIFLSGGLFYKRSLWKFNFLAGNQRNQLAWLGVADSLIIKDRKTNVNEKERDRFAQCLLQLQNKTKLSQSSHLQSSAYYTFLKGNYDFNLNAFLGLPTTNEMYNYAFLSHLAGFFSSYNLVATKLNWTTGIHGNTYNRRHTGSEKSLGELYTNKGFKNEFSVFSKANYSIEKITVYADLQYRTSSFDYKGSVPLQQINWSFFNPKAGVSFEIKPGSTLYYSVGKTSREPTRNDLFGGNDDLLADSTGTAIIVIKEAESVTDHELGFRHQSGKLYINFDAYYMNFKNEIVLNGKFGPNGLALTNKVDKSFRTGIEISLSYQVYKNLKLINNSSFNHSRIREQHETFTPILTPPVIINQEIEYSFKRFLLSLTGRYQHQSFIDFANTADVKSYFLLNSRIQYQFNHLLLTGFFNNITNTKYFNNGYVDFDGTKKYFVQAPVNFFLSATYRF